MEMKAPAPRNPIDDNRQGLIGKDVDRIDGRLKVTGRATYAYETQEAGRPAYGFIVEATIAKGRIADIDSAAAEAAPGVLLVMTHKNAPAQAAWGPLEAPDRFGRASPQLRDDRVRYYGEAVAYVVAESFEEARSAAKLVRIRYAAEPGDFELDRNRSEKPKDIGERHADSAVGDFASAFASAPVTLDASYSTPHYIHSQMEPHATLAVWNDDRLTVYCSAQLLMSARKAVAATLQIPSDKVRILSRYIGGGFGGKLPVYGDVMLSALAARQLGRPVKTALTRQQMFHFTTHRSQTSQRVRLGATPDGQLTAIAHESWSHSARFDNFYESASAQTRSLYAAPNRMTAHRVARLDLPIADSTRAPGEAVGLLALESAMDELAVKLKLDPIELRRRNEPSVDPEKKVPYSTRQLVKCMQVGAERFGWNRRNAEPGSRREGRWLVGIGMSAATRSNILRASKCTVLLDRSGVLTARMAMTDIGTGSYTVLSQIAAEMMGLPIEKVRMELGDSDLPETPGSGGSFGAESSGSGLFDACSNLREKFARRFDAKPEEALFADGRIMANGRSESLAVLAGPLGLSADGEIRPGELAKKYSQQAYGAHFAEVAVDMDTGEIRLRRMLGVFACGRVLNKKTATSQATGAMIWGVGSALFEEAAVDPRYGYFVNHDLAEYHLPAHADIPSVEAIFVEEVDDTTNPLRIKGLGELGICGAGASIANAVYNATGVRIRDFPLTLDKVLAGLELG